MDAGNPPEGPRCPAVCSQITTAPAEAKGTDAGTPLRVPGVPRRVQKSPRRPQVSCGCKARSEKNVLFRARATGILA